MVLKITAKAKAVPAFSPSTAPFLRAKFHSDSSDFFKPDKNLMVAFFELFDVAMVMTHDKFISGATGYPYTFV